MDNLWVTLGRGREGARARGQALVQRGRETGIELLGRFEGRTTRAQRTLAARRELLNGKPIERLERRVLTGLEELLESMGLGLRTQIRRLTPGAAVPGLEPQLADAPIDAELVPSPKRIPAARARTAAKKKRAAPAAASAKTANGRAAPTRAKKSERPKARRGAKDAPPASTRWVRAPGVVDLEALAELSAKELAAQIPTLDPDACRALLAREKQSKKRKTVLEALSARLKAAAQAS